MAGLVMGVGLGSHSVWADEGFTISTSRRPIGELLRLSWEKETTGAPYAIILHGWMEPFGTSEAAMRSLSVVFAVAAIALVGWIGHRLGGPDRAILAMVVLALHGTVLEYGQSIRFYAFVLLVGALSMAAFVAEVLAPRRSTLALWAVATVLLPVTHLLAAPIIGAQMISILALPRSQRHWRRRLPVAIAAVLTALAVAALVSGRDEGQSIVDFDGSSLREVALSLTGAGGVIAAMVIALGALVGFVVAAAALLGDSHVAGLGGDGPAAFRLVLPALWLGLPVASLLVLSVAEPAFLGRYLLVAVPGLALLVAQAIEALWQRAGRAAAAVGGVAVIAALSWGAYTWLAGHRGDDWRSVACLVQRDARAGDAILFANDSVRLFFEYERTRDRPACRSGAPDAAEPTPRYPAGPWGTYRTGDQRYTAFGAGDVRAALAEHRRAWLVTERYVDLGIALGVAPGSLGRVAIDRLVEDTARVVLVERRPDA
jgi:mannosyltransferase